MFEQFFAVVRGDNKQRFIFQTPFLIPVEYDGDTYDELHVDGGAASQVFLYPLGIDLEEVHRRLRVPGRAKAYVIRNSRLDPIYEQVENKLFPIAGRSVSSLDPIELRRRTGYVQQEGGLLPHWTVDFTERPDGEFDVGYMRKLFDTAYARASGGYPWEKMPPELKAAPIRCN